MQTQPSQDRILCNLFSVMLAFVMLLTGCASPTCDLAIAAPGDLITLMLLTGRLVEQAPAQECAESITLLELESNFVPTKYTEFLTTDPNYT
ncbi:MAG: hypothetical protein U9Q70_11060 [Chloroflexota bacterium]|nr:hypothetical protein [Chloroflexota bacterium]